MDNHVYIVPENRSESVICTIGGNQNQIRDSQGFIFQIEKLFRSVSH